MMPRRELRDASSNGTAIGQVNPRKAILQVLSPEAV